MQPKHPSISISLQCGAAKGWRGFVWMLKIIIPVSLITFLLDFSGWLGRMDGLLEQLMGVIHLPAMAALPLLAGLLTGIYGTIAAMSVLPFSSDQMILMAVFLLIAHSLIQEGWVQHQSGCNAWMATAVRLAGCRRSDCCGVGLAAGPGNFTENGRGAIDRRPNDFLGCGFHGWSPLWSSPIHTGCGCG